MKENQKKTIFYSVIITLIVVALAMFAVQSLSGSQFSGLTEISKTDNTTTIQKSLPADDGTVVKDYETPIVTTTPQSVYVPSDPTDIIPEPTDEETVSTPIEVSNMISYVFDWNSNPTFVNRGDLFELAFDSTREDLPYSIMVWKDPNGEDFYNDISIAEASGYTEQSVFTVRRVNGEDAKVYEKTGPTRDLGTGKNYLRWLVPNDAHISQYFYAVVWENEGTGGIKLLDYGKVSVGQPG